MSCVTCQTTPPPERQSATRVHEGHVAHRFGDGRLGLHILYRGQLWTHQTIEAVAGDETTGWVEALLLDAEGTPRIHPPGPYRCPACFNDDRNPDSTDPCPECHDPRPPDPRHPAHPVTIIRRGQTTIIDGTHILTPPHDQEQPERQQAPMA